MFEMSEKKVYQRKFSRESSLESLKSDEEKKLLDEEPLRSAMAEMDVELIMEKAPKEGDEFVDKNDENIVPPKMNTFVGLLRLTNFLSATTVIFILVSAVMNEEIWKPGFLEMWKQNILIR